MVSTRTRYDLRRGQEGQRLMRYKDGITILVLDEVAIDQHGHADHPMIEVVAGLSSYN
jgi:hypothetical protein